MSGLAKMEFLVTLPDREFTVEANNADLVRWDMTAAKHKWPQYKDAPFLWTTFLAWCAARRTGQVGTDVSWETFSSDVVRVETNDAAPVDPTDPEAASG